MSKGDTIKQQQKRNEYIAYANKLEKAHGLPNNIIVGLMSAESSFRPEIISGEQKSSAGAIGILQFMPATAKEYGIDPTKPYQSINAAVKYLKNSYKQLGNWEDSIRSYNAGVGAIKQWKAGKRQLPKETREYLGRVQKGMGLKPTSSYAYSEPTQSSFQTNDIDTRVEAPIFAPNTNLASVPDIPTEEKKTESEAVKQLKEQQSEKNFLQDFYTQQIAQQEQEQPQVQRAAPIDVLGTYNQAKQFVEQPLAIAQQGGMIKDQEGQRKYPNQVTEIQGNIMATNGYGNIPLYVVPDVGQPRVIMPNTGEHIFKGATKFVEYPITQDLKKYFNG